MAIPTIRVLVVDPSDDDRRRCVMVLESFSNWHISAREETTLEGARRALDEDLFECVLVNKTMPDGEGIELLADTQARISPPAVVVMTDPDDESSGVVAIQSGAQDCVKKNQLAADLPRAVRYALERKRLEDKLRKANERLQTLTEHDELTGLLNRRGLDAGLIIERRRAQRDGTSIIALLIDIDKFKETNDKEGHAVGDLVIRQVARHLLLACRVTDHAARVGGDEFALVLPDVSLPEARNVAERVRLLVNTRPAVVNGRQIDTTVSIGISEVPAPNLDTSALLRHCRFALTHSKKAGRDRVSFGSVQRRASQPSRVNEPSISDVTHQRRRGARAR